MGTFLLFFTSIASIGSYILFILFRYGIQPSISQSFYKLPKNQRWIFTVALWLFIIPLVIITKHPYFYFLWACIGVIGITPAFDKPTAILMHYVFGICSLIWIVLYFVFETPFYGLMILMCSILGTIHIYEEENHIFWEEVTTIFFILLSLILNAIF